MSIGRVQQGAIGEFEVVRLTVMASKGKLDVAAQLSDDDWRDELQRPYSSCCRLTRLSEAA
jgi:hypothetical protein